MPTIPAPARLDPADAFKPAPPTSAPSRWRGFWRRPTAVLSVTWLTAVALMGVFAPLLASGHPLLSRLRLDSGEWGAWTSPLLQHASAADLVLPLAATLSLLLWLAPLPLAPSRRPRILLALWAQIILTLALAALVSGIATSADAPNWLRTLARAPAFPFAAAAAIALLAAIACLRLYPLALSASIPLALLVALLTAAPIATQWRTPLADFDRYAEAETSGAEQHIYTLIPWSPAQRSTSLYLLPPGSVVAQRLPALAGTPQGQRLTWLGTDSLGSDVLAQLLCACRLAISIGLVSTSIAVFIGVSMGAAMGYLGGWVDLLLFRVVEVFMGVPLLFLLILAAAVLPRDTYVMMAIIGCCSWTGAARFTRAECLKLRSQDFVLAARAAGLPTTAVVLRHVLPSAIAPVLVESSFAIAAAILAEATLSYLGLSPPDQPSWGRLLARAAGSTGQFVWWLAIFPGAAIFLTVLSYNLLGEALRDALDPRRSAA